MIGTFMDVVRGEGAGSALTRVTERAAEAIEQGLQRARGASAAPHRANIVNMLMMSASPRFGGVAVQLRSRLHEEQKLRSVALVSGGTLQWNGRRWRAPDSQTLDARAIIVEGGFTRLPRLPARAELVLAVHDLSLISADAHNLVNVEELRRNAVELFSRAHAAVFPSAYLRDVYRDVIPDLRGEVIEPGIALDGSLATATPGDAIAIVGSIKPHKGGGFLPAIIRAFPDVRWHLFGGGDVELIRAVRDSSRAAVHGYYRAGALPHLLAKHRIGLAVLPSIVPESFSLTLSECWSAGVPVVAFEHGAIGERVSRHGGGLLAPPGSGAAGLIEQIREWRDGRVPAVPKHVPTAREAAAAHVALYRALGILN